MSFFYSGSPRAPGGDADDGHICVGRDTLQRAVTIGLRLPGSICVGVLEVLCHCLIAAAD